MEQQRQQDEDGMRIEQRLPVAAMTPMTALSMQTLDASSNLIKQGRYAHNRDKETGNNDDEDAQRSKRKRNSRESNLDAQSLLDGHLSKKARIDTNETLLGRRMTNLNNAEQSRQHLRFEDLRSRLFGLAQTFDESNSRDVCDVARTFAVDYFSSLYEMSYGAYRYFDRTIQCAYTTLPVTLAFALGIKENDNDRLPIGGQRTALTTESWLAWCAIEEFCRVQFYRLYEYLRCAELQHVVMQEALDRDDYAIHMSRMFLRDTEERLIRDRLRRTVWATVLRQDNVAKKNSDILTVLMLVMTCVRAIERSVTLDRKHARRKVHAFRVSKNSEFDDRSSQPTRSQRLDKSSFVTSLDLALAAMLRQKRAICCSPGDGSVGKRRNDVKTTKHNADGSTRDTAAERRMYDAMILAYERLGSGWPVWNLRLSRQAVSRALFSTVESTSMYAEHDGCDNENESLPLTDRRELINETLLRGDTFKKNIDRGKKLWSGLSCEQYDYMAMYRSNARYDRIRIRSDSDFYIGIFTTIYTYLKTEKTVLNNKKYINDYKL